MAHIEGRKLTSGKTSFKAKIFFKVEGKQRKSQQHLTPRAPRKLEETWGAGQSVICPTPQWLLMSQEHSLLNRPIGIHQR